MEFAPFRVRHLLAVLSYESILSRAYRRSVTRKSRAMDGAPECCNQKTKQFF
jgi:hypothetical protein